MSEPTIISGRLVSAEERRSFSGIRVVVLFLERIVLSEDSSKDDESTRPFLPSRRVAAAKDDGAFQLTLPPKEDWQGPLSLYAESAAGIRLGEIDVPADTTVDLEIPVRKERPPEVIQPSDDPTLGKRIKFTGRAIDSQGNSLAAGPLVVFWGVPPAGRPEDRFPIAIAELTSGGYFSGTWPPDILGRAFAQIAGGDPIDVPLENQRFPVRVILIATPPAASTGNGSKPPRAPDDIDLASNPEGFAADPKPCADFTIPNRTVEEVSYHALVRTTQPEVQGLKRPLPFPVPPRLIDHIVNLASRWSEFETPATPRASVSAGAVASGTTRGTRVVVDEPSFARANPEAPDPISGALNAVESLSLDVITTKLAVNADEVAERVLARRDLVKSPLRFESSVLAEMAQDPGPITPRKLLQAEQASTVRRVRAAVGCLTLPVADRFHPGPDRQINWESIPGASQATTIAHGHLLTIKQVWRSDGYSLGDLLYSLPLAPGQQKLVSIRDWVQSQIAMRAETRRVTEDLNATLLHDRHLQVSQEIAHVQECLFIPLRITPFTRDKALAWRGPLQQALRSRRYLPYFDALERVVTDWQKADFPLGRYADDLVTHIDGEFRVRMTIPRPADTDAGDYDETAWEPFRPLLGESPLTAQQTEDVWDRYMGVALPSQRPYIWNTRLAPGIAQRLFEFLKVEVRLGENNYREVLLDVTVVTTFRQNAELLVTFRPKTNLPVVTRAQIDRVRLSFQGIVLPAGVEAIIDRGSMYYRTDHINHFLFLDTRVLNDLSDGAEILTPLDTEEKRNPRELDRRQSESLLDHLNYHVEYYTRATWRNMHPNHRYMLLDGAIAPNASGRSVASVVENRIIAVVGNSLVMPVAAGVKLDSTYVYGDKTPEDLIQLYATDPPPPMRVSLPTRGVFAEAILGKCNSCEVIDDTVFWRWEEAPIPDSPTAIQPISTAPRDTPAINLQPTAFPDGVVRLQQAPTAPAPTGMEAALQAIGLNNIFRDLTGLQANQLAASGALDSVLGAAKSFSSHGLQIAQQRFLNGQMDRALSFIKQAREKNLLSGDSAKEVTADLFRRALNLKKPEEQQKPSTTESAKSFLDRIASGVSSAALRIANPAGLLELLVGPNAKTSPVDFAVSPSVSPIMQDSPLTCWAAAGAMMASWRTQASMTIDTVLGDLGGQWLAAYKASQSLTIPELHAFAGALGLKEEARGAVTVEGMLDLLQKHGPLWVIADDSMENNKLVHARIVTAIKGDSSPEGTEVTFVDTAKGEALRESFKNFVQKMTASDTAAVDVAMLHY